MKRQSLWLCLVLVTGIQFYACKEKGGSGEAYTLKMRLAPGDKFKQDMDVNMAVGFEVMGQTMKTDLDMKGLLAFDVSGDTNNLKKLRMTYEDMAMSMKVGGMPGSEGMNFDSMMKQSADKIIGKSVTMLINDKNEIVDVTGFDDIMVSDDLDMATREQVKKMFSKEQMNSMLAVMFQMYPDKPVKVGDSWEKEIETSMADVKMKVKGKYTLKSVKDGVAYIDVAGNFSGKGSMNREGMAMDLDMNGTQEGMININIADGYLKDSDYKMDMKADVNMMGQKMPMTIKGTYLIKGK